MELLRHCAALVALTYHTYIQFQALSTHATHLARDYRTMKTKEDLRDRMQKQIMSYCRTSMLMDEPTKIPLVTYIDMYSGGFEMMFPFQDLILEHVLDHIGWSEDQPESNDEDEMTWNDYMTFLLDEIFEEFQMACCELECVVIVIIFVKYMELLNNRN